MSGASGSSSGEERQGSSSHSRGHRSGRRRAAGLGTLAGVLGLALLAGTAAAGATYAVMRGSSDPAAAADRCAGRPITVAVAPEIVTVVNRAVEAAGCTQITVTPASSAAVAAKVAAGKGQPDVWIPESSLWLTQVTAAPQAPKTLVRSVAASPVVLVAGSGTPPADWATALADPGLDLGDPLTSTTAATPLLGALGDAGAKRTAELVVPLAQRAADQLDHLPADRTRLATLVSTRRGLTAVSEQEWLTGGSELAAAAPKSGTVVLDYPALVTAPAARRTVVRQTTGALARALTGRVARTAAASAGFRDAELSPISGGVGTVRALHPDATVTGSALRQWATLVRPSRFLAVFDVSGSMLYDAGGGSTRMRLTMQAAEEGLGLFPDSAAIGLWAFSQADDGKLGGDHEALVPIRALGAKVDGVTQKQLIGRAIARMPGLAGGGTSLYDTTLAAYKAAQAAYDPTASNSIILFTDGANDDPGSISGSDLLSELHRLADPDRPVRVIAIGISADADSAALEAIARATGGQAYIARRPQDIGTVFRDAIAGRAS